MNYHFFDYKYNIQNFSSDLFSTPHIVFIILTFTLVPLIAFLLRKTSHKKIDTYLKIVSVGITLLEIFKVTWESYFDITTGHGFNTGGILPFYTCSLFMYTMLLSAYCKNNKVKDFCLSFITTIGLMSGGIAVVQCNGLNYYPFWTFGGFYSLFYHFTMFFTGVFLLVTRYKKLEWIDMLKAVVPMLILSVGAIPLNFIFKADYMQLYSASGVPLMSTLADILANANLRFLFSIIMLITYIPFAGIVVYFSKFIAYFSNRISNKNVIIVDMQKDNSIEEFKEKNII